LLPAARNDALEQVISQLRALAPAAEPEAAAQRLIPICAAIGNQVRPIPVSDVIYFEATDKYVRVLTVDSESLIRMRPRESLDLLDPDQFWQIHRGMIVDSSHVMAAVRDNNGKLRLSLRQHLIPLPSAAGLRIGSGRYSCHRRAGTLCYDPLLILCAGGFMLKTLGVIAIVVVIGLPAAALLAGQMHLLSGRRPNDLGVRNGLLKPPLATAWNSVSSQAGLHPHTDYHTIAPLRYGGDGHAAFARLTAIVTRMPGATIVNAGPDYLYAQFQTRLLKFVDDVEFLLDEPAGVIQMRSASRLGRKDFGVNRKRLEEIRARFETQTRPGGN
jgi:uncharacterized protein (DUF1499 family)